MERGTEGRRLVRKHEVKKRVGLSKSEIHRRINEGTFPQPVPLGPRAVAWLESEIEAWITARLAARDVKRKAA